MLSQRERLAVWLISITILMLLSYIVLGHTGYTSEERRLRLIPFYDKVRTLDNVFSSRTFQARTLGYLVIDVIGNIVVFVPLGFALVLVCAAKTRPGLWAISTSAGLSLVYEVIQFFIPGRVVATDDIFLNTTGAAMGAWLALRVMAWRLTGARGPAPLSGSLISRGKSEHE